MIYGLTLILLSSNSSSATASGGAQAKQAVRPGLTSWICPLSADSLTPDYFVCLFYFMRNAMSIIATQKYYVNPEFQFRSKKKKDKLQNKTCSLRDTLDWQQVELDNYRHNKAQVKNGSLHCTVVRSQRQHQQPSHQQQLWLVVVFELFVFFFKKTPN